MTSKPERNEIATSRDGRDITRGWLSPLQIAPPDDPILITRGGGDYRIYEEVLRDDHVRAGLNQRLHGILAKPWEVQPGGKRAIDRQAADFLRETLDRLEWDRISLEMLHGIFFGFSVAEAIWDTDGRKVLLQDIRVRNRRRFAFDGEARLRLRTFADPVPGELLPERKFWVARFGADHFDAPYGLGLAHYLYWPVWLKRNAARFWAVFLEKFGTPTVVGKYPSGTSQEDQDKLLQALQALQRDASMIFPEGMLVELIEAKRSGTADHAEFIDAMNEAILMICLGQTATAKGTSGSLGAERERERVKDAILKADADLLSASFNATIAKWLTEWNFPGAAPPTVWRIFDDEDLNDRIERDKKLAEMGFRPTLRYVQETYGGEWEEAPPVLESGVKSTTQSGREAFAEGETEPFPDQAALDQAIAELVQAGDLQRDVEALVAPIREALARGADETVLLGMLAEADPEASEETLIERLTRLLWAAQMLGRIAARREMSG